MNRALWIVQGLLAAGYLAVGAMHATQPTDSLAQMYYWVKDVPPGLVRFIGVVELLGAIGLIVPLAIGILPWLTAAAAVGLAVFQICAIAFHASRQEVSMLPLNLILLLLAVVVAYGRFIWHKRSRIGHVGTEPKTFNR